MQELNEFVKIGIFLMFAIHALVGAYSIGRDSKSKVTRLWFLVSIAVVVWSGFLYLLMTSEIAQQGIWYSKLLHLGASFIPIFFFHFILALTGIRNRKKYRPWLLFGYLAAVIFGGLSFTELIVFGSTPIFSFDQWVIAGSLYPLLLFYFWFYAIASASVLGMAVMRSDGVLRRRYLVVLAAAVIGFVGGGSNFLPQTLGIYPYGNLIVWLDPLLITYGIFIE